MAHQEYTPKQRRQMEQIHAALGRISTKLNQITPELLASVVRKRAKLDLRVSDRTKAEMQEVAEAMGLSVAEYILDLHEKEMQRLRRPATRRKQAEPAGESNP